jgi:tetratricopeptide (TPR) repeat protein
MITRGLIAIAALPALALAQGDQIVLEDGSTVPPKGVSFEVQITGEDYQAVKYRRSDTRAVEQRVEAAKVATVTYGTVPRAWEQALLERRNNDPATAAESFKKAAGISSPFWLKAHGLYEAGETYFQMRDWNAAIQAFDELLQAVPDTRFLPQALLRTAEAYFQANDFDKAKSALEKLQSEARAKGFASRWANMASYWEIRLTEQSGDITQTVGEYQRLYDRTKGTDPKVANSCALRIGLAYIKQKDFAKARRFYEEIASSADDGEVQALSGAYLGLGNCFLAESGNDDKDKIREAQRNFLRVIVAYYDDPTQKAKVPPEIAAEALYQAGLCFEILRDEDYRRRSRGLYNEVMREFDGSEWAIKARKRM